jgi:hypothetical protein
MVLSLDSLAAGLLIGLSGMPVARTRLALAFGLCDALGTSLGSAATGTLLVVLPVLIATATAAGARFRSWRSVLPYGLPVLFALDNVLFPAPLADVAGLAVASAALAWLGLAAGSAVVSSWLLRWEWRLGLAAMACLLFLV